MNLQSILIAAAVSFIIGAGLAWNINSNICDGKIAELQSIGKSQVIAAQEKIREDADNQLMAKTAAERKSIEALNDVKKTADILRDNLDDAAVRLRICTDSRKLPATSRASSASPASNDSPSTGQSQGVARFLRDRFERCDQIIIEHNEIIDTLCGYWPADPRWIAVCKSNKPD